MNGFWSSLSSPALGRPGRSCSFQASFILNSVSKQHFPPSTLLIPGSSPSPRLPDSPTVSTTHFLSPIRTIKVHTLLTGKQGRNIFFFLVFLSQHLPFVTWVLSPLSPRSITMKKKKKGMHSSHKAGTIFPTVFCTMKFTFLKYCLNLFSKNIFL